MNDPHVVSLTYQMKVGSSIRFNNPPALEREHDAFQLRLDAGTLVATMKAHFATSDEARLVVDPALRAWEIDTSLTYGPSIMSFSFDKAEVIDRSPPPGTRHRVILGSGGACAGGKATVMIVHPKYPEPPSRFCASEAVRWMWHRYQQFKAGKEPLPSMAYFCLSLLEGTTGQGQGARAAVCALYHIDRTVRDKLGDLISEKGSPAEARKLDHAATHQPLTHAERSWVEAVVKALIRRKAEYDADPAAALTPITLSDFPAI
jgi:hypothetical protein